MIKLSICSDVTTSTHLLYIVTYSTLVGILIINLQQQGWWMVEDLNKQETVNRNEQRVLTPTHNIPAKDVFILLFHQSNSEL